MTEIVFFCDKWNKNRFSINGRWSVCGVRGNFIFKKPIQSKWKKLHRRGIYVFFWQLNYRNFWKIKSSSKNQIKIFFKKSLKYDLKLNFKHMKSLWGIKRCICELSQLSNFHYIICNCSFYFRCCLNAKSFLFST